MPAPRRRGALPRALTTSILAASVVLLPGSTVPAAADEATTYRLVPGTVLSPRTPDVVLPMSGYLLTGRFGDRSGLWASVHTGLDFAAPSGTPIRSIAAGTVVSVGYDGAYGNKTVVRLADGTYLWYCHQTSVRVTAGEQVRPGELIGTVGSTGNVTGPHLHLEVRPTADTPVDPLEWLRRHGVRP